MSKCKFLIFVTLVLASLFLEIGQVAAAPPLITGPNGYYIPDYYTTPNWANSPPLAKFVDPLPGLWDPRNGPAPAKSIPMAVPDIVTYPGSDYYELELREYSEVMHSALPATRLRGYVQVNNGTDATGLNTVTPAPIRYLGPVIIAQKDRPVRVKFTNALQENSSLFLPVDTTVMGSGTYEINYDPVTKLPTATKTGAFSQNRATLHLHGGRSPWISDGTAHQWATPALEDQTYGKGVSVAYVPDMWFDAAGQMITETTYPGSNCAGQTTCATPGATNNPGAGSLTFFWTNKQSSRMMFYHDHAFGITRLNVYAGEAAGYLLQDPVELALISGGTVNGRTFAAGTIPADQIPLVIQDKTFVDGATILTTDPTWAWGTQPGKPIGTPVTGDLWWPHVYIPAENPYNPNFTGMNDFGRWVYAPWFNPPVPVCGTSPSAVKPWCIEVGPVDNPYAGQLGQSPIIPGTPIPSTGAEAFMDTMMVNGAVYPTKALDPGLYRFRILNASHDRFLNLQWYRAVNKTGYTNPTVAPNFAGAATDLTEVAMVPANLTSGFPAGWPTDGREGGVPDPATRGPAWIQIGTEGGFLPAPVVLPNQPVVWNTNPTMFNVGNVLQQNEGGGTLFLGPAERADVIVDLRNYAGHTLILYNDAPTAFPALVGQYDYYTGAPDRTGEGGYGPVQPGTGPNIRTVMQITVNGGGGTPAGDDYDQGILDSLKLAFASDATTPGVFKSSQEDIIVGQGLFTAPNGDTFGTTAYNDAYNKTFSVAPPFWGVYVNFSDTTLGFENVGGTNETLPLQMKAMHDEMGGVFDDYGRMSAKLGLDMQFANAGNANFSMQQFVDSVTEIVTPGDVQIWRISHNGVDTHPIHFHLFEVQVINRLGWDGFARLPDPNELGWKDTIRVSPLEDTIIALRPILPDVPFKAFVPNSIRPLNPTTPLGSMMGFSQIDIRDGGPLVPPLTNQLVNFGWEYTWHCHILSHEENDMMRPVALAVPPEAPSNLTATWSGSVSLTWADNSLNENNFTIQRATDAGFTTNLTTFTAPGNTTTSTDTTVAPNQTYYYRVLASNTVGGPAPYPTVTADSAWSNVAQVQLVPIAGVSPTSLAFGNQTVNTTSAPRTVTLSNTGNGPLTFSISFNGANPGDFAVTNGLSGTVAAGGTRAISVTFRPTATGQRTANLNITTNDVSHPTLTVLLSGTGTSVPTPPAAPTNLAGAAVRLPIGAPNRGTQDRVTLTWTDNANNETGFQIQRALTRLFLAPSTFTVGANVATFSQNVNRNSNYYYRVRAVNAAGNSAWSNVVFVTTP